MDMYHVVLLGAAAVLAIFAGKGLFKADTAIEQRRYKAGESAVVAGKYGLTASSGLPVKEFLLAYSVGDYSKALHIAGQLLTVLLSGDQALVKMLDELFTTLLAAKLATREGQEQVFSHVSKIGFTVGVEQEDSAPA